VTASSNMFKPAAWCLMLTVAAGCAGPTDEELKQRVAVSLDKFDWNDYSENLKGLIGAGPVAEWTGKPVDARIDGSVVTIRFRVEGPWKSRTFGIPIMIREPRGAVFTSGDMRQVDGLAIYQFRLTDGASSMPPWLELQYPHGRVRLAFRQDGTWEAVS